MELISKEEVLALIDKHLKLYKSEEQIHTHYELCTLAESIREELPVIESRPKGKWIDCSDEGYAECPFCQSATNCDGNIDELHYCWNCGAELGVDMRGEE